MGGLCRQSLQPVINVGIQNTLQGSQGSPTQSAVRSEVMVMLEKGGVISTQRPLGLKKKKGRDARFTRRAAYLSEKDGKRRIMTVRMPDPDRQHAGMPHPQTEAPSRSRTSPPSSPRTRSPDSCLSARTLLAVVAQRYRNRCRFRRTAARTLG